MMRLKRFLPWLIVALALLIVPASAIVPSYNGSFTVMTGGILKDLNVTSAQCVGATSVGQYVYNTNCISTLTAGQNISIGSGATPTIALTGTVPIANGGTGTATPALSAGANIAVSGTWPDNTIALAGTVPVANGGTGSATQNFVDLTTTQTVNGPKTFTSVLTAPWFDATNGGQLLTSGSNTVLYADSQTHMYSIPNGDIDLQLAGASNNGVSYLFSNGALQMSSLNTATSSTNYSSTALQLQNSTWSGGAPTTNNASIQLGADNRLYISSPNGTVFDAPAGTTVGIIDQNGNFSLTKPGTYYYTGSSYYGATGAKVVGPIYYGTNGLGILDTNASQTLLRPASASAPFTFANASGTVANVIFPDAGGISMTTGGTEILTAGSSTFGPTGTTVNGSVNIPASGTATSSTNYGSTGSYQLHSSTWNGSAAVTNTYSRQVDGGNNDALQYNGSSIRWYDTSGNEYTPPAGTATSSKNYGSLNLDEFQDSIWNGSTAMQHQWGVFADSGDNFIVTHDGVDDFWVNPSGAINSRTITSGDCLRASGTVIVSAAGDCVTSVTASGNLASSGGTTPAITMAASPTFTNVTATSTYDSLATSNDNYDFPSGVSSGKTGLGSNTGGVNGVDGTALSISNSGLSVLAAFDKNGNEGVAGFIDATSFVGENGSGQWLTNTGTTSNGNTAAEFDAYIGEGAESGARGFWLNSQNFELWKGTAPNTTPYFSIDDGGAVYAAGGPDNSTAYVALGNNLNATSTIGNTDNAQAIIIPNKDGTSYVTYIGTSSVAALQGYHCYDFRVGQWNGASNSDDLCVDGSGNLGVRGNVTAANFFNGSRRAYKTDIHSIEGLDALAVLEGTNFVSYHYKPKWGDPKEKKVGFVADDTPSILSGPKHDHFDAGALATVDAIAVKQLSKRMSEVSPLNGSAYTDIADLQAQVRLLWIVVASLAFVVVLLFTVVMVRKQ